MNLQNIAVLSLGSNQGDRQQNIETAITNIHNNIATVIKVSRLYETPAWGFDGDTFYNAVLLVHTHKTADELLLAILMAEKNLGRERTDDVGYQPRTIDIDIISFNDLIVDNPGLTLPHPKMQERNFVLYPLQDVDPGWVHPILKQDIATLMGLSPDKSSCKAVGQPETPLQNLTLSKCPYIAIEGNIGAGKTTLSRKLSEDFNAKLILERFAENPFLPKFYKDQERYAFSLETSFLADRYRQLTDDLSQYDFERDFVVADYHIVKSLIFSQVTLKNDEYNLYQKLFEIMYREMRKPCLYVYLHQNTETLLQQIKKRGRDYEQDIKSEYLNDINKGYFDYFEKNTQLNVLVLDISQRDFVTRQHDYIWILEQINNAVARING